MSERPKICPINEKPINESIDLLSLKDGEYMAAQIDGREIIIIASKDKDIPFDENGVCPVASLVLRSIDSGTIATSGAFACTRCQQKIGFREAPRK